MRIFGIISIICCSVLMFFVNIIVGLCYLSIPITLLYLMYITYLEDKYHNALVLNFKTNCHLYMSVYFKKISKSIYIIY